jgi:hypothetical protein
MIDANNLLQIDGVVIAGILILLTIKSFKGEIKGQRTRIKFTPKQAVAYIILPFSISAISIIIGTLIPLYDASSFLIASIFSIIGFVYLVIVIFAISTMSTNENQVLK